MAFEEDLGFDPSQPRDEDYTLNATGLVSKTLGLWTRKFVQYLAIIGFISVATTLISFIIIFTFFGTIGLLSTDPINYLFGVFALSSTPDLILIAVTVVFGAIAFVVNAVLSGAAIKFSLDDYAGQKAEIGSSFSHSVGKTGRIVTVQVILTLIVSAVTGPSLAMMSSAFDGIDISDPFNPIITPEAIQQMIMGSVLLLVGGIFILYVTIRFAPALAIVVDTDLSAIDSLKKAWELTNGNFLHVLGGQILIALAIGVLSMIVGLGLIPFMFVNPFVIVIEVVLTSLFFSAPGLIFITVLYRDLLSRSGPVGSDLPEYVL
jgi:hypothetical protein